MTQSANPYESPHDPAEVGPKSKGGALAILIVIVVLTSAINVRSVCQNWVELTLPSIIASTGIWFGLPLVALYLIWRGKTAGRWILVVLFALRVAGELAMPVQFCFTVGFHAMLFPLVFNHLIVASVYLPAAAWLAFSPSLRRLVVEQRVQVAAGRNLPLADEGRAK